VRDDLRKMGVNNWKREGTGMETMERNN